MKRPPRPTRTRRPSSKQRPAPRSYTPLSDALQQPCTFADTELADGISRHRLSGLLLGACARGRRSNAEPLGNVLWSLLLWPLLAAHSMHCFCSELSQVLQGKVSVLYDFLGREDVNWRGLATRLARQIWVGEILGPPAQCAFVVDDTTRERAGRKIEGTSRHFDHTEGRHIQGHLMLTLGLAGSHGFLPVESQLVQSQSCAVDKRKPFADQRSAAARDLRRAQGQSKHELFRAMLQRAMAAGFRAGFVLADAWFGCKESIEQSVKLKLTAIFQMKRGTLTYRYHGRPQTAHQLYARIHRRLRARSRGARYKTTALVVDLNLETDSGRPARWQSVRLIFSAPVRDCQTHPWVVFLCTSLTMSEESVLQTYALRWSIEVYFKEIKQHLGYLKEQSGRYQVAYASVHLAAIRYLLLFEAMIRSKALTYGEVRDRLTGQLRILTYAALLWELFRGIIQGVLEELVQELGHIQVQRVLRALNEGVETFLANALQIHPAQIAIQLEAEELGYF